MKCVNAIPVYEIKGEEPKAGKNPELQIVSHWNRNELVILQFDDQPAITVAASDLLKAIQNATNVR